MIDNNDEITRNFLEEILSLDKCLLLVRGLPGSGKSTTAKTIVALSMERNPTSDYTVSDAVAEADSFFENRDGANYHFNSALLQEAHTACYNKAKKAIEKGCRLVAVSNTFTKHWEMFQYVQLANMTSYFLFVVEIDSSHLTDKMLESRNVHGVKADKILSMRTRFEPTKVGLWTNEDIIEFLFANNAKLYSNRYIGLRIPTAVVIEAASFVAPLLLAHPVSTVCEGVRNLQKRNKIGQTVEYHLTIVPPDMRKLSANESTELLKILSHTNVVVNGAGFVTDSDNTAYFLTVEEESIYTIREWLRTCGFDAMNWYPHITVAFIGSDVHGVPKLPSITKDNLSDITARISPDAIDLTKCLLHPLVNVKAKMCEGYEYVDVSVASVGGLGDDLTYKRNSELLSLVPRGLVFARAVEFSGHQWKCVLRGLTKFTGTIGNDDDVDLTPDESASLLNQLFLNATHFRRSKKENGRSGAISVVRQIDDDKCYVCIGTKLSHVITVYDISNNLFTVSDRLTADSGSDLLVRNIIAYQNTLGTCNRQELFRYLGTDSTLITEVLDYQDQHIERLPQGLLEAVGINVVRNKSYVSTALCDLQSLGYRTTFLGPLESIHNYSLVSREMKVGRTEGYVVQFYNSDGEMTGLLKVKCIWYVVVRAIREMTKSKLIGGASKDSDQSFKKRQNIQKVINELQSELTDLEVNSERYNQVLKLINGNLKGLAALQPPTFSSTASSLAQALPQMWATKFEFLRHDVYNYQELLHGIISCASVFVVWFATEVDAGRQPSDVKTFSSTYPLIWDEFLQSESAAAITETSKSDVTNRTEAFLNFV